MATKRQMRKELAEYIRTRLTNHKFYVFRSVIIDGINCYIILYRKNKLINVESIHTSCTFIKNNKTHYQKYSLYHTNYDTIENAIDKIEFITRTYKLYNGDLMDEKNYNAYKLEEEFIPYKDYQSCCICYKNTIETTLCNHYICFHCREKCLVLRKFDCPLCRKQNILSEYNTDHGLINNEQFSNTLYFIAEEEEEEYADNPVVPPPFTPPTTPPSTPPSMPSRLYQNQDQEEEEEEEEDQEPENFSQRCSRAIQQGLTRILNGNNT
jgi:hypothetical protein